MRHRILLVDDHQILRQGLVALLAKENDLDVVGEASDGRSAVALAKQLQPNIVVMDVAMPGLNGIDATRQILAELPHTKIIALSMHADKRFVMGMLKAGASGYLLKHCALEELVNAIRVVISHRTYLSPDIAGLVVEDFIHQRGSGDSSVFGVLTLREREVLQLYAEGKITRQIGELLHVSIKTVESHRKQIMDKLGFQSFAELIKYAIREGLTSLEI
jgi:two-component system, NarL family, response regulator NreC